MSKTTLKSTDSVAQINTAIELISNAHTGKQLEEARNTATAFIDAAYESEDITLSQKHQLLKKFVLPTVSNT